MKIDFLLIGGLLRALRWVSRLRKAGKTVRVFDSPNENQFPAELPQGLI